MFPRVVSFQTRLVIGALSAVVFASSIGCGKDEITPEDRLRAQAVVRHGVQLAEEGELDSAAIVLEKALRYDSSNAEALYRLGMVYEYLLRPADAETAYRRALRNDSSMAVVHFNLGQICGRSERYDEAVEHFEAALRTDTTRQLRALSHYCVGLTHGIQGNFARATDAYADARREDTLVRTGVRGRGTGVRADGEIRGGGARPQTGDRAGLIPHGGVQPPCDHVPDAQPHG